MRVSEYGGLTKVDLAFAGRQLRVDHRLIWERDGEYYVEKPKAECGCRYIPMTDEVYRSLKIARENGNDYRRVQRFSPAG